VEQSGNVRVITFTAGGVRNVENVLARELGGRTDGLEESHLLLDFTNVVYLTSLELGTLVALHKRLEACGGRLTLFNLNARIYEVFTVTHLQKLLEICREGGASLGGGLTTTAESVADGTGGAGTGYPGDPDKYVESE
jgi:anti-anti-sigma factor